MAYSTIQSSLTSDSRSFHTRSTIDGEAHPIFDIGTRKQLLSIDSIQSLLSFTQYFCMIGQTFVYEDGTLVSAFGVVEGKKSVVKIGQGASFLVYKESEERNIPRNFAEIPIPEHVKRVLSTSRPDVTVVKIPRTTRHDIIRLDPGLEVRCLRAIAWECHVLSHPSIKKCQNIISMLGITWRPVFSGNLAQRRLLPALVMEFAEEGALSDYFNPKDYSLSYATKWKLTLDIGNGLQVLHECGIVHGDIKAENVLLGIGANGELIPKLADFACSLYDWVDPPEIDKMPGISPPWNAPETYLGPMIRPKLFKTDIYSFGLLAWRIMFEGQTPFDDTDAPISNTAFDDLFQGKSKEEKKVIVENLKRDENDKLLLLIKGTLSGHGLNQKQLDKFFDLSIRYRESNRANSVSDVLDQSRNYDLEEHSSFDTSPEKRMSIDTLADFGGRGLERNHNWFDILGRKPDILQIVSLLRKRSGTESQNHVPAEVRIQIFDDLNEDNTQGSRIDLALCFFTGFGCMENHEKGLEHMVIAAQNGDIRARAIIFRLHQACDKTLPPETPIIPWLSEATSEGSRIASADLLLLDPNQHAYAMEHFRRKWNGVSHPFTDPEFIGILNSVIESIEKNPTIEMVRNIGERDHRGWKMIHLASTFEDVSMLKRLLDIGVDINEQTVSGETALLCACRSGRILTVKLLLYRGADAAISDKFGCTPLHYIICIDAIHILEVATSLLAHGADIDAQSLPFRVFRSNPHFVGEEDLFQSTPLYWAAIANRVDVFRILLDLNANPFQELEIGRLFYEVLEQYNVNTQEVPGSTPSLIAYAAETAQIEIIETLAQKQHSAEVISAICQKEELRKNVIRANVFDQMCLHGAEYKKQISRMAFYQDPQPDLREMLGLSIVSGSLFWTENIINRGCDPNAIIPLAGLTPIQLSCTLQKGQITLFLLGRGADPQKRSPKCLRSCMSLLAMLPCGSNMPENILEIVTAMIERGLTYDKEPSSFQLIYRRARKERWIQLAMNLLTACSPEDKDGLETSLLELLLSQETEASLYALSILLDPSFGHKLPSPMINMHQTIFHYLALGLKHDADDNYRQQLSEFLTQVYPEPEILNKLDKFGRTALQYAASKGDHCLLVELLKAGADPEKGYPNANLLAIDHAFYDDDSWELSKLPLSWQIRRQRKSKLDSIRVLAALIEKSSTSIISDDDNLRIKRASSLHEKWGTNDFMQEVMSRVLSNHLKRKVILYQRVGQPPKVKDIETQEICNADRSQVIIAMTGLWELMLEDWKMMV